MKSIAELRQEQREAQQRMQERLLLQGGKTIEELVKQANRKRV